VLERVGRDGIAAVPTLFLANVEPFLQTVRDGADVAAGGSGRERAREFSRNASTSLRVANVL